MYDARTPSDRQPINEKIPPETPLGPEISPAPEAASLARGFLRRYFCWLALFLAAGLLILAPYAWLWLAASGDVDVEGAVDAQARGDFAIFGSGVTQDFADYKLRLYARIRPEITALGSSRVMQFRGAWFSESFLNMGGAAGNISMLAATARAMLEIHRPRIAIIGIDFWWFLPQWEKNPHRRHVFEDNPYNYGAASLRRPWQWLLEGKISPAEFAAPLLGLAGHGFRAARYGIMAQRTDDGFGPDGSWYYTGETTGKSKPWDFRFEDTLMLVERGIKAFYHAPADSAAPSRSHLEAFADIYYYLLARGVKVYVFIPPLAGPVLAAMSQRPEAYAHLFHLREALAAMDIDALDLSDPRLLASGDCEFVDGFHGGEVTYARILRALADHWPSLLAVVRMPELNAIIRDWQGNAQVPDVRVTSLPETDFMRFGCNKKVRQGD